MATRDLEKDSTLHLPPSAGIREHVREDGSTARQAGRHEDGSRERGVAVVTDVTRAFTTTARAFHHGADRINPCCRRAGGTGGPGPAVRLRSRGSDGTGRRR
ncbi:MULTISPECIES: hypothetical protein [Streptomyces]|uniref:2-phosphosulfolactate phosphatase n=1 Tax=Streptomyces prasinus TaxID=67345 RepID=A0ABX6AVF5_9ACTN|nr:hypothetical protein [Streptomyces prasinus]QEV06524.1 hypothetical protein CP972_13325 [Streptomyces prasinus]